MKRVVSLRQIDRKIFLNEEITITLYKLQCPDIGERENVLPTFYLHLQVHGQVSLYKCTALDSRRETPSWSLRVNEKTGRVLGYPCPGRLYLVPLFVSLGSTISRCQCTSSLSSSGSRTRNQPLQPLPVRAPLRRS